MPNKVEEDALKKISVTGLDRKLYEEVMSFANGYGVSMNHIHITFLERGYRELLKTKDLKILK